MAMQGGLDDNGRYSTTQNLLSSMAIEVLGQLFVQGPVWDGNLVSKTGRDILVERGLASREEGWNFLTNAGVRLATDWDIKQLASQYNQSWYKKAVRM